MGYSSERKEAVLKKMLPPGSASIATLSKEEGISDATLYNWRVTLTKTSIVKVRVEFSLGVLVDYRQSVFVFRGEKEVDWSSKW